MARTYATIRMRVNNMFEAVLVANRGEIACRIIRTCHELGMRSIAVYSEADEQAAHVQLADEAILLGPAPAAESYLAADRIIEAARVANAEAIHPGYGFLSENASFARAVEAAGLAWVGPTPESMLAMADKITARNLMQDAGVPVAPGTREAITDPLEATQLAQQIGYPIMVKAAAGGGGIGMTIVHSPDALAAALQTAQSRAERFFGSAAVFLEKYIARARHIEVQVLGLGDGQVAVLGERDCSVQRRHQKVIEESRATCLSDSERTALLAAGRSAAATVNYRGAGTVEFLFDLDSRQLHFLEMNTRLQVEHPVTELVTGIDIVAEQLRIAAGQSPSFSVDSPPPPAGHAMEFRVYAEDPQRFLPGPGTISQWDEPHGDGIRIDAGYRAGDVVTPYYDPLMAKLCVWAADRDGAIAKLRAAAAAFTIVGPKVNLPLAAEILGDQAFINADHDTGLIDRLRNPAAR